MAIFGQFPLYNWSNLKSAGTLPQLTQSFWNFLGVLISSTYTYSQLSNIFIKKNEIQHPPNIDANLRRFFIRPDGFGGKEDWKVAAVMVINFGETAAGSIATAVKNRTAEENAHLGPEVSKMIVKDCFMDDVNISGKYGENIDVKIKQAEAIMAEGGFKFKEWVVSGSPGEKQIGEAVTKD